MWIIALLAPLALAGKLAEGFRGIPFGDAAVISAAPIAGCTTTEDPTVPWVCETDIGSVRATVGFIAHGGTFYGYSIVVDGAEPGAEFLRVAAAAYGEGKPINSYDSGHMSDRTWMDGDVRAIWKYNQFSKKGTFSCYSVQYLAKAENEKKAAAETAVNDL